jgi:hypothetical protein
MPIDVEDAASRLDKGIYVTFCLSTPQRHNRGSGGRPAAPLFLNLGITWGWVVNIMSRPLHPPERAAVIIEQECWPQRQSEYFGE